MNKYKKITEVENAEVIKTFEWIKENSFFYRITNLSHAITTVRHFNNLSFDDATDKVIDFCISLATDNEEVAVWLKLKKEYHNNKK